MTQKNITAQRGILDIKDASEVIKIATQYRSNLWIEYDGHRINTKSLLGILCMGVSTGTELKLIAEGPDEELAMENLMGFLL